MTDSKLVQFTNLPENINGMQRTGIDLVMEYWTPEKIGESKKVYFYGYDTQMYVDKKTAEEKSLEVAIFIERTEQGTWRTIKNGSSNLVNSLKHLNIQPRAALEIEYQGKQKNKTNEYTSDTWSIYKLK